MVVGSSGETTPGELVGASGGTAGGRHVAGTVVMGEVTDVLIGVTASMAVVGVGFDGGGDGSGRRFTVTLVTGRVVATLGVGDGLVVAGTAGGESRVVVSPGGV